MSSQLLARTSQRLKQLLTSPSTSKKSTNDGEGTPTLSPASGPVTPATPRRASRPHSWISHTSSKRCDVSHIEAREAATSEENTPRIEPYAIPNTDDGKGRTKSTGNAGLRSACNGDENDGGCHAPILSRSETSLCAISHTNSDQDGRNDVHDAPSQGGLGVFPRGGRENDTSPSSPSGRFGTPTSQTSCLDTACRLRVPRKSSRRGRKVAVSGHGSHIQGVQGSLELFPSPPIASQGSLLGRLPERNCPIKVHGSSDRWGRDNTNQLSRRDPHTSTLDLFEALSLDPDQAGDQTPTQELQRISTEEDNHDEIERDLPLTRTAWSDDVEQLIRETDKAFKAVGFALSDAKSATGVDNFKTINWGGRSDLYPNHQLKDSGSVSPKKSTSMRTKAKAAAKTPLTRNASIKATKQKSKKGSRKVALQAFPTTIQNPSPRWTLPEVTAELFGGRIFGRLEADEMLKSEESMQRARWSRECKISEREREERQRDSMYSMTSVETREEDRSTPVEPFHLEELSSRLSNIKLPDGDFETPRPSPRPPIPLKGTTRESERFSDSELAQPLNTVLPSIPIHSPISPPTQGTFAVFNATAPLSPVSAIPQPLNNFHENGLTDQDPLRFGKMKFPSPPIPSQPQPIPRRASRSRSVTRTNLATIRETSPADPTPTHSQSMPATPAKNRSPIRSPPSRGTPVGITPPSPESPQMGLVNATAKSARQLQSAVHSRGCKQNPNTRDAIATTEAMSGSLSPRKVTPYPSQPTAPSLDAGLISTPFSLTAPMFRHGSIRLNKPKHFQSFPVSGITTPKYDYDVEGADGLQAQVIPLDWTAFQMAISGGAGEYHMPGIGGEELSRESDSKKEEDKLDRKEREDLFDWWKEFGFRGRDGGMGRVLRSEPRKGQRKGKGGKSSKVGEEKKRRKASSKPQVVVAELEGNCFSAGSVPIISEPDDGLLAGSDPTKKGPRPFSFMPGQEEIVPLAQASKSSQSLPSRLGDNQLAPGNASNSASASSSFDERQIGKLTPPTTTDTGYDSDDSLPDSPMEEISEEALREGRDVLMGFNLNNDLPNFLRWESERSVRWEYGGREPLYEVGGVERSMSY